MPILKAVIAAEQDLRILTAILPRRVNHIITEIIHPDQTGFITGRYYGDNLRRLLNIISHQKEDKSESMIMSLDAQKAFDRVSWQYLFQTLKRFKFGPNFLNWIQTVRIVFCVCIVCCFSSFPSVSPCVCVCGRGRGWLLGCSRRGTPALNPSNHPLHKSLVVAPRRRQIILSTMYLHVPCYSAPHPRHYQDLQASQHPAVPAGTYLSC